tara:strand:- start:375 stop:785 length:411 start_codon:yes stop_codon:yes gene_type:complete
MVLSLWSSTAAAEETGKFTFLGENEPAPFEGVLFDPTATATILAERAVASAACEVRLNYELDIQAAEHELQLQNLQIRHDALVSEYDMRVSSLQRENEALTTALKKQSRKNTGLWVAVGVISGVALSYTAYEAFNE